MTRAEIEKMANLLGDEVYDQTPGFPSEKEWPALCAAKGFIKGATAVLERVKGLEEALDKVSYLQNLTLVCDACDFDMVDEAYSAGATNAYCGAAEIADDALKAWRGGK